MKIAIVSTVHPDNDVRIYHKQARTLAQEHEVYLIAPRRSQETYSDVQYLPLRPATSRADRLRLQQDAYARVMQVRPDVVHLHDPELLVLAHLLKRQGIKVVWDVHEDLPKQIMKKHWIPGPLRRPLAAATQRIEAALTPGLDAVVSATPAISRKFEGHPHGAVIRNYPLLSEFQQVERHPDRARFVYVGGISKERGIDVMVDAMSLLDEMEGAELHLAGKWTPAGKQAAVGTHWFLRDHGFVGRQQVADLLSTATAGLVVLEPTPNHIESLPIKLFEYMAAGVPVIASDFPLWREIVEDAQCGLLVKVHAPSVAAAMQWMIDHPQEARQMGENGRRAVQERYNWNTEAQRLTELYRAI